MKKLLQTSALALAFLGIFCAGCQNQEDADHALPEVISAYNRQVARSKLSQKLHLFIYPDYLPAELLQKFKAEYGVEVVFDYYDNNDALLAKMQAGGAGQYDLLCPSDYAVTILLNLGLLEKIEHANIPNLKNLDPRFRHPPYDPDLTYGVPYQWGTTGLGIRSDLVDLRDRDIETWDIVFDPAKTLGPFTMLDDSRETIGAALKYLGYSLNTTNEQELQAAEQLLRQQRKRMLAYAPSSPARDYLVSGDAVVVHNYSGDVFMGQAEQPAIIYAIPREGGVIWTDNLVIPKNAPNRYAAEVFLNFILDAENGAMITNYTRYASPNQAALPYIDPEIKHNPGIYTRRPETLENLEYIRDVGPAARRYDEIWTRVKTGG